MGVTTKILQMASPVIVICIGCKKFRKVAQLCGIDYRNVDVEILQTITSNLGKLDLIK